ncbi:unnamed protein product [Pleuronectes platessa]|uniref:Uncharacterized protein n=1 Tax=Pleuronectes platessa TaxID=8262 RepID=A0A9N7YDF6_PLEPL|nr:unnamed protein product [Pleuronectes platessa]
MARGQRERERERGEVEGERGIGRERGRVSRGAGDGPWWMMGGATVVGETTINAQRLPERSEGGRTTPETHGVELRGEKNNKATSSTSASGEKDTEEEEGEEEGDDPPPCTASPTRPIHPAPGATPGVCAAGEPRAPLGNPPTLTSVAIKRCALNLGGDPPCAFDATSGSWFFHSGNSSDSGSGNNPDNGLGADRLSRHLVISSQDVTDRRLVCTGKRETESGISRLYPRRLPPPTPSKRLSSGARISCSLEPAHWCHSRPVVADVPLPAFVPFTQTPCQYPSGSTVNGHLPPQH